MKSKIIRKVGIVLCAPICLLIYLLVYTFFHEGGHALVALLYGGRITHFVLGFNAHVSQAGANFSTFGAAFFYTAGTLLPVILCAIAIGFYQPKVQSVYYYLFYVSISMVAASLLPWVFIPALSLFAQPPPGDDVTRFLKLTSFHPLLVSLAALLLISAFVFLVHKKGIFGVIKRIYLSRRSRKINFKHMLAGGVVYLAVMAGVVYGFNRLSMKPTVFTTSFHVQDARIDKNAESQFVITRAGNYVMDLAAPARGLITVVRITGADGKLAYQYWGGDFSVTDQKIKFEKGNYTLSVLYLTDMGTLEQFFKNTGQKKDLSPADRQSYEKVFNHPGHDYSADFSIKIQ